MQFIKDFGSFWRSFIVGDDWTIALGAVWGLLLVFAFISDDISTWYIVPIVAIVSLGASLRRAVGRASSARVGEKDQIRPAVWLLLPMAGILIGPYSIHYLAGGDLGFLLPNFLLPMAMVAAVVMVVYAILVRLFRRYPVSASLVGTVVTFLVLQFGVAWAVVHSGALDMWSRSAAWAVVVIVAVIAGYGACDLAVRSYSQYALTRDVRHSKSGSS